MRTLDQQRREFAQRGALVMPLGGAAAWTIVGIAGIFLPPGFLPPSSTLRQSKGSPEKPVLRIIFERTWLFGITVANWITIILGFIGTISAIAAPQLILNGPNPMTNECHAAFADPGVRMMDAPVSIAAGAAHSLALRADGSVEAWGLGQFGETNVPAGLGRASAIAANAFFSLALQENGSVVAWGYGPEGETNTPPAAEHNIVAISAGYYHVLALRSDGTVIGWGDDAAGENDIPASATNVIAIAAGGQHSLALRRDGSVAAWGWDNYGQNEVPASATNVVAISDSIDHCLALRSDGTVVTWGYLNGARLLQVPARATNAVGIVAIDTVSMALRADGSVIVWGDDPFADAILVPATATNVVEIAAAGEDLRDFCLARRFDGSIVGWGENEWGETTAPNDLNNVNLPYTLTGDLNMDAPGTYSVTYTATNILGEVGTATRTVVVVDTTPPELTCPTNMVVEMTETDGAEVSFVPQAVDLCSGTVPVTCDPPSGSKFPIGSKIVTCNAVDASGNSGQCSFNVTVLGLYSTKTNILAEMKASDSSGIPTLNQVINSLAKSITAEWWTDELHLNPKFGGKVFSAESETARLLQALQRRKNSGLSAEQFQDWINRLVKVDQLLAQVQIDFATNAGISSKQLAGAVESLTKGNTFSANNRSMIGIANYGQAWAKAMQAVTELPKRNDY